MPAQRFDRESVLDAALGLVRERGYDALSTRAVAERAGCSVQPIYSLFGDMEGLMQALYEHARAWVTAFNEEHAGDGENLFESNGLAHLRLAREEPLLFAFLYLSPYLDTRNLDELYRSVSQPGVEECIMELGHLDAAAAHELYLNMIVYTHGLAVMLCAGADIPDDELADRVFIAFQAFAIAVGGSPKESR
ncbi:MAG: TetR/AcrR family transcriptional regulator [Actinomycetota bacterium]|jgi:AcrR family transcriptional regulator|nr:TetR/AcrR family transcriptional regulator [Actinomycetota bacterium]